MNEEVRQGNRARALSELILIRGVAVSVCTYIVIVILSPSGGR